MATKTVLVCPYCDHKVLIDMYYEWSSVPETCEICKHPELIKKNYEIDSDQFGYNKDEEYYATLTKRIKK